MAITKIATIEVGAGGAAILSVSSIPASYTDLLVVISGRSSRAATDDNQFITINGVTTSFSSRELEGNGSSASSGSNARYVGVAVGNTSAANTFSSQLLYFPNYAGATNKSFSVDSVSEANATAAYQDIIAGLWANTAAITSISVACANGNYQQYSSLSVYGVTKGSFGGVTVS